MRTREELTMAEATRGTKTTLVFGLLATPVQLFKTTGEPGKDAKWETAGPSGGALRRDASVSRPLSETKGNPLASAEIPASEPGGARESASSSVLYEGETGAVVSSAEVRRGVRREDGKFIDLTEQIDAIAERSKLEEMEIVSFVRRDAIPRARAIGSYYLAPAEGADPRVLRLLLEAMREENRVAVVRWTKTKNQALGVVAPGARDTLVVLELAWAEDVRVPSTRCLLAEVAITPDEVAAARELVREMSESVTAGSLATLRDDARRLREELLSAARSGRLEKFAVPERSEARETRFVAQALRDSAEKARTAA
jgi:non-homologous end joining protein Ku